MHPTGEIVPQVDVETAKRTFAAVHDAIQKGLVRACHDLSEGGLGVALAEMAFAGGWGAKVRLADVPRDNSLDSGGDDLDIALAYSESASRFVVELPLAHQAAFEAILRAAHVPFGQIGEVTSSSRLQIASGARQTSVPAVDWRIDLPLADLKEAWQKPLRW